jgi:hypothetical protein
VAIRNRDLAAARPLVQAFADSASAGENPDRVRQGQELLGLLALADGDAHAANRHLADADQQDPFVLYARARALALGGGHAEAQQLFAKVASYNDLPTLRYAMVRRAAQRAARPG